MQFFSRYPIFVMVIATLTIFACASPQKPVTRQTASDEVRRLCTHNWSMDPCGDYGFNAPGIDYMAPPASPAPPTQQELAMGRNAAPPPSKLAAQMAAKNYFNSSLKDPYSAKYKFYEPVNSHLILDDARKFGWFICGVVNAKNSYGGYTGDSIFLAFLDPNDGTRVIDGSIESDKYKIVEPWCAKVYNAKNAVAFSGPETDPSSMSAAGANPTVSTTGNVFKIEDVDKLKPGMSTITEAKRLLGAPTAESNILDQTLLQWQFVQATGTSGKGAHVAILFDKYGRMIRVQHKFSTGQ